MLNSWIETIKIGEPQRFRNITILPLLGDDGVYQYRTLGEALATSDVLMTEVSAAGSVPELLVVNRGATPVLLVDGEEVAGAKQNRVLNTSVLLIEKSETHIPVSCTEQGRWSYASPAFTESGNVMAHTSRSMKLRSVSAHLHAGVGHSSDQGEVWDGISMLQSKAKLMSPTSAMKDVFAAREQDLLRCQELSHLCRVSSAS